MPTQLNEPLKPTIETPLGRLRCTAQGKALSPRAPGPGELAVWKTAGGAIRLRAIPFLPLLPSGMRVDGAVLILWTLEAHTQLPQVDVVCELDTAGLEGGPASGEGLEALTWVGPQGQLSLGTYDAEFLRARASKHAIPARWTELISDHDTVLYVTGGLLLHVPPMNAGERAVLHMAAAWLQTGKADGVETWYAVDVPFAQLEAAAS